MKALPEFCDRVLIESEAIQQRVTELARELERTHEGEVVLATVLKGGLFFMADLCRNLDLDVRLDFMAIAPYRHGHPGSVQVTKDLDEDLTGRDVVLVEDMVDTGLTLNYIRKQLLARNPARLQVCALFDKPARRIATVPLEYVGFELPDHFVVGYGLDLNGLYRNLPYLASVRDAEVGA